MHNPPTCILYFEDKIISAYQGKNTICNQSTFLSDKIVVMLEGFQSRSKARSIAFVCQVPVYPVFFIEITVMIMIMSHVFYI